jgi:mevalonate kinase
MAETVGSRQVQSLFGQIALPRRTKKFSTRAEDADILSTNYPVLFKFISGAREQNQKPLVRIMRELLSKMELEGKEFKEAMEREQSAMIIIGKLTNAGVGGVACVRKNPHG